jgi:hypothetical protein
MAFVRLVGFAFALLLCLSMNTWGLLPLICFGVVEKFIKFIKFFLNLSQDQTLRNLFLPVLLLSSF